MGRMYDRGLQIRYWDDKYRNNDNKMRRSVGREWKRPE